MKTPSIRYLPLLCQPLLLSTGFALPTGGQVQQGHAAITEQARQMVIQQASERAVIHYDSFSIGEGERVQIHQPNQHSVLLNKVRTGGPLSEIYGQLEANGQVFLVNPAGIVVGKDAQIDVGGLLLTTHHIDDHEFLSGQFQMSSQGQPSVVQIDGSIQVDPGSFVMVVAPKIDLGGDIVAQFGKVSLVAADGASVLLQLGQWPDIQVTQATYEAWIHHHGLIDASGGLVQLTAASASDLIDRVIFHEGTTSVATTQIVERDGRTFIEQVESIQEIPKALAQNAVSAIEINAGETTGYVDVSGQIDASGDLGKKTVDILAEGIVVQPEAQVKNNGVQGDAGVTLVIGQYLQVNKGARFEVVGGAQGDGGFIELSGLRALDMFGDVDLSAPGGEPGHLLIDPRNITINGSAQTGIEVRPNGGVTVLEPESDSATVNADDLVRILRSGDVTVTTEDNSAASDQVGTLRLAVDLDLDGVDGTTLTLRANEKMFIDADIGDKGTDPDTGNANIVLEATRDIEMSAGTRIDAGTGTITVNSEQADFTVRELESAASDTAAISITVGGSIIDTNEGADNVILTGGNAVLDMTAGSNIDILEGVVPILRASAPDVRGFTQTQAGDLRISSIESAAPSVLGFTASTFDGDILLRPLLDEASPGIHMGGDGPIVLTANGAGSNVLLESNLTTENGWISLFAVDGAITMGEANTITSDAGAVSFVSSDSQTIGLITTGSESDQAISLEVTNGEDILDAHDASNESVNLQAPNGGLELVNADNVVGLESEVKQLETSSLFISNIVLNELDDLIVTSLVGTNTALSLKAGGEVAVGEINTGNSVSITAQSITEFYVDEADRLAKTDVASITADSIELLAESRIGDVTDGGFSVVDYLDVATTDVRIELLSEVINDGVNEVAVQQVSSQNIGDLVVTRLRTPSEAGSARVFLSSINNGIDLSGIDVPNESKVLANDPDISTFDSTDVLGLAIARASGLNPVRIVLPALEAVQAWALEGLVLDAASVGTSITTSEVNGEVLLSSLITNVKNLAWSSNQALDITFGGDAIDLTTTEGSIDVVASSGLDILDLNGDTNSLVTGSGNLNVTANGGMSLSDTIAAADVVNDGLRAGLIDLATNFGDIIIGGADVIVRSTNDVDTDVDGGLGSEPNNQTAIRIAQNNPDGTANIDIGSASTSANIQAQGGDIYIASGARAVTRDLEERTLNVFENTLIEAFDNPTDDLTPVEFTEEDEVTLVNSSPASASIQAGAGREISLTSRNIAGFNLTPERESEAETAADDVIRADEPQPIAQPQEQEDEANTRINVVLDTVVPGCESGESIENSSQCMKKQGFKEFLRSLVIGRGFPDKVKGLPE